MSSQCEKVNDEANEFYECPFSGCGRLFKTKFSMKRHSLVHNAEKNYACKYCGKKFALPQYLKEHTYTHTHDKPYVCGVAGCQKRFRQAGKLSLHRRTHKEYVLKQYECPKTAPKDEKAELAQIHGETEHQTSKDIKEPKVEAEKISAIHESNPKCDSCVSSRPLWRQDSGQTNATAQAKDDMVELFAEECMQKPVVGNKEGTSRLTMEALEQHNQRMQMGDALLRYLSCIDTDVFEGLRPVLPPPHGKVSTRPTTYTTTSPDLFELTKKFNES